MCYLPVAGPVANVARAAREDGTTAATSVLSALRDKGRPHSLFLTWPFAWPGFQRPCGILSPAALTPCHRQTGAHCPLPPASPPNKRPVLSPAELALQREGH